MKRGMTVAAVLAIGATLLAGCTEDKKAAPPPS